jgi:magnesium chelatase family protein
LTSIVTSIGLKGLEGYRVRVEVQALLGQESIVVVGLPDATVKESKERIFAALYSSGFSLIGQKIKINLAPSELKKNGPLYDLPMAIGILLSVDLLKISIGEDVGFIGALSLDGTVQSARGLLPAILAAKKLGIKKLYIPCDETIPTIKLNDLEIINVHSLQEVVQHLYGENIPSFEPQIVSFEKEATQSINFQQIIGHSRAKRALEVAAAGEHHSFLIGPPGCGKSMLAESFPSILPPLTKEAQLEMISIYQLNGTSIQNSALPPFRNPHHSASGISIIGGGQNPKPGEVSLAHRGVLFLDEMAEFSKKTLEMLRQPLESGKVTISRVYSTVSFPASFILIGAMNPCPCGYLGSNNHYCVCTSREVHAYQNKLSGPMRDRFDIFLRLKSVELKNTNPLSQESSETVKKRVIEARKRQFARYGENICNSRVPYEILIKDQPMNNNQANNLQQLSSKHNWSNRAQIKIIRLARTIADLEAQNKISDYHIKEAIFLRTGDSLKTLTL